MSKPSLKGMDEQALHDMIRNAELALPYLTDTCAIVTTLEVLSAARERLEALACSRGSSQPLAPL